MASNRSKIGTSTDSLMLSTPFLGGLNTELTGLVDSTDFTREELNMVIRADGSRARRPGIDYEEGFQFNNELVDTSNPTIAFNSIEWVDINSPDEADTYTQIPYIVVQIGYQIIFFKNEGQPYSKDEIDYTLDLRNYKISGKTDAEVASERCKFAIAYGCLFITSKAIKPIRLRSAQDETVPYLDIVYPYCKLSCAAFQGKHQRMGSTDWYNNLAYYEFYFDDLLIGHFDIPLNGASYVPFPNSYTMAESFNGLDAAVRRNITATSYENAPDQWSQPNTGWPNWTPADWITFNASSSNERGLKISIKISGWAYKSGRWHPHENWYTAYMAGGSSNYTNAGGLNLQIRDTSRGANDRISVDENPTKMSYAHLYNLLNQGWTVPLIFQFYQNSSSGEKFFPGNNLAQQYLKDVKTEAFKPQDLINMTFGNTPAARGHFKLDFFNQDRNSTGNLVANMQTLAGLLSTTVDDIRDKLGYTGTEAQIADAQVPIVKPRRDYVSDICAYAGRIFYLCGDVLLYSQMISEDVTKTDKCYTEADPTSEELSDIIETDGGLISLPDIGEGIRLAQYGGYLYVFGTRGNAVITGTANNIFTATAYSAGALNTLPTQAPDSFVTTEFGVFYWGTTGIVLLGQDQGGVAARDLSTDKILVWYGKLTNTQHKWCKGVYSSSKKKVYWFYPSDDTKPRRLDLCLVYDITRNAFTPQQIATGFVDEDLGEFIEGDLPEIVSGVSLKVPFKSVKEYPVLASSQNFCDLEDGTIRVTEKASIKHGGFAFRVDTSSFTTSSVTLAKYSDFHLVSGFLWRGEAYIEFNMSHPSGQRLWSGPAGSVVWVTLSRTPEDNALFGCVLEDDGYSPETLPDESLNNYIGYMYNSELTVYNIKETGTLILNKETLGDLNSAFFYFTANGRPPFSPYVPEDIEAIYTGKYNISNAGTTFDEVTGEDNYKILADHPIDSEEFTYESSVLVCLDVANQKITFGDFRNNLLKDWTAGDWNGDGYNFTSYLISHPMNAYQRYQMTGQRMNDYVHMKNLPYLITYFRRTETGALMNGELIYPSGCFGSVLWDWRTTDRYGKWSSPSPLYKISQKDKSKLYKPYKKTIFDQGYIINKTNIRGLGRAYQVKLESDDNKQFILEGIVYDLKNDGRV